MFLHFFKSPFHLQAKETLQHLPFLFSWGILDDRVHGNQINAGQNGAGEWFHWTCCRVFEVHVQKPINSSPLAQVMSVRTNPPLLKKEGGRFGTSGNH